MGKSNVGRPKRSYKYINPKDKKAISAVKYHKVVKDIEKETNYEKDLRELKIIERNDKKRDYRLRMLWKIREFVDEALSYELNNR